MSYTPERPPSRLYKYQPFTGRALAALKARTLWFGRPSAFNDPFDCSVPYQVAEVTTASCQRLISEGHESWGMVGSDPRYVDSDGNPTTLLRDTIRRAGEETLRAKIADSYLQRGVTCFCEVPDDTLLWSHYGGAHRGICLEFDTADPLLQKLHKVRYTSAIPTFDIVEELLGDGSNFLWLLLTKAECWAHEREWRAIHIEANREYCYGVQALTGVYLGAGLTPAEKDVVGQILLGSPTKVFEIRRTEGTFQLGVFSVSYQPYDFNADGPGAG